MTVVKKNVINISKYQLQTFDPILTQKEYLDLYLLNVLHQHLIN